MKSKKEMNLKIINTSFSGYKYSISFVGNPSNENCLNFLCDLLKAFGRKLHIFSTEKDFLKSVEIIKKRKLMDKIDLEIYSSCWGGFVEKENELVKIYNSSKINLNFNCKKKKDPQIFQILASGGFLMAMENDYLKKHFEASKHLETFSNTYDLIDKINFYLNNLNIAQKIASLGKFEVIKNYISSKNK